MWRKLTAWFTRVFAPNSKVALGLEVFREPLPRYPRPKVMHWIKLSPRHQPRQPNPIVANKDLLEARLPAQRWAIDREEVVIAGRDRR